MNNFDSRLLEVEKHILNKDVCIMIIGLGSVGTYLLDYLVSLNDPSIRIVVVGRNFDKMQIKVNIVRISATIRELCKSKIEIDGSVDLNDIDSISCSISKYKPDFIINSSRAYPGLKYGTISWKNIRAYGLWSPLAVKFTRNIMQAIQDSNCDAITINTSYSDAVNIWLKSAGKPYPDFGSGNLNHLVPRIKYAVAEILNIEDVWNVDVMFATGHFHDVCISKEGQTEGIHQLLKIYVRGEEKDIPQEKIFERCSIPMPTDETRNMMNASSNYRIITAIIETVRTKKDNLIFTPGVFGNLGGYPVKIKYDDGGKLNIKIDETVFSQKDMELVNAKSMYLDGIEKIENGILYYTDELIQKVKKAFSVDLPKSVRYDDIDKTAQFIIDKIILPQLKR